MNRLARLALALLLAAAPLFAASPEIKGTFDILPSGATAPTVIAADGNFTSAALRVGESTSRHAISWDVVTASGSPSLNIIVLQSNTEDGTYSQWATLDGSTVTPNVTATTANGGSALLLIPGKWRKYRVNNTGTQNTTPTLRGLAQ